MSPTPLDSQWAARFAGLALNCIGREFPNHPQTLLTGDDDVRPPRDHTPAFFGCFDWHSAVHAHWTLLRLLRCVPGESWGADARDVLHRSLSADHLAAEVRHLSKPGREGFERPYGLAWLLQLAAEIRQCHDADADVFADAIAPLEWHCRERLASWLPKLTHPIRSGEHSQTAFAMGLAMDWARVAADAAFEELIRATALRFYGNDRLLPIHLEPSGHDFLSPSLAEADLMRRVLPTVDGACERFPDWLERALPRIGEPGWLEVAMPADRSDGKLAHLDGLNLSRAWMLDGIAASLPADDARREELNRVRAMHAAAGLASVTGEHYAGGHWLGTFATYLLTRVSLHDASSEVRDQRTATGWSCCQSFDVRLPGDAARRE